MSKTINLKEIDKDNNPLENAVEIQDQTMVIDHGLVEKFIDENYGVSPSDVNKVYDAVHNTTAILAAAAGQKGIECLAQEDNKEVDLITGTTNIGDVAIGIKQYRRITETYSGEDKEDKDIFGRTDTSVSWEMSADGYRLLASVEDTGEYRLNPINATDGNEEEE